MGTSDTKSSAATLSMLNNGFDRHFYQLRDRALRALGESGDAGHALVLTSCHAGEGVTTVAANLALATCQTVSGKVLICDASGTGSPISEFFDIPSGPGLTDHVTGKCDLEEAIHSTRWDRLDVLPSGSFAMAPSEMVSVSWLKEFFAECRRGYALTIIDAAPVMESNTTALLAAASDGTILVIKAEHERWEVAQRAKGILQDAGARLIGAVLNKRKHHIPKFLYDWL